MLDSIRWFVNSGGMCWLFFAYRNRLDRMVRAKAVQRREAMGGLAKGLAVIRAFTRDRATLSLSDVAALTDRTVTDPVRLRQLIEDCRRSGYAAVEDELAYGVVALAVPVFDQYGRVVAALNSSSHSRRISKAKLVRERFTMLQKVSRQITADIVGLPGLSLSATA